MSGNNGKTHKIISHPMPSPLNVIRTQTSDVRVASGPDTSGPTASGPPASAIIAPSPTASFHSVFDAMPPPNLRPIRISTQALGQGVLVLMDLKESVKTGAEELEKELRKKKKVLGISLGGKEPKIAKELEKIKSKVSWLLVRLSTEQLFEKVPASQVLEAYRPVAEKLAMLSVTLANAGDERDGYAHFHKKERKEVAEMILALRTAFTGLINLLLGQPIRERRLSDAHNEATVLYSRGEHTLTMLKKAELAWSKNNEKTE